MVRIPHKGSSALLADPPRALPSFHIHPHSPAALVPRDRQMEQSLGRTGWYDRSWHRGLVLLCWFGRGYCLFLNSTEVPVWRLFFFKVLHSQQIIFVQCVGYNSTHFHQCISEKRLILVLADLPGFLAAALQFVIYFNGRMINKNGRQWFVDI